MRFRQDATFAPGDFDYIRSEILQQPYPTTYMRTFLNVDKSVPATAEKFVSRVTSATGEAAVHTVDLADDIPLVDVSMVQEDYGVVRITLGYAYSILDEMRALQSGPNALTRNYNSIVDKAVQVRNLMEQKLEEVLAFGIPDNGGANFSGFINHDDIGSVGAPNGDWANPATTAEEIIEDILALKEFYYEQQGGFKQDPTTLILPFGSDSIIATKYIAGTGVSVRNKLSEFLSVREILFWPALTAPNNKAILYNKSPLAAQIVMPMLFTEFPRQLYKTNNYIVPTMMMTGGVEVRNGLQLAYLGGI